MNLFRLFVVAAMLSCGQAKRDQPPAPDEARNTPAQEIVAGGGRVRGGGFRMDVQVGGPFVQPATSNGTVTARPAEVVTP